MIWAGVTWAGISRHQAGPSHSPTSQNHFPREHPPFENKQIHVPSNCCVCRAAGEKWPRQMSQFTAGCNSLVTQRGLQGSSPTKWVCNTVVTQGVSEERQRWFRRALTRLHCLCKPQIQVFFWTYTARRFCGRSTKRKPHCEPGVESREEADFPLWYQIRQQNHPLKEQLV